LGLFKAICKWSWYLYNLGMKKIAPFSIYSTSMLLTIIYVPLLESFGSYWEFVGWGFIWELASDQKIYLEYLLIQILVISLIYFAYLFSQKK
jgi:hypothetical protein